MFSLAWVLILRVWKQILCHPRCASYFRTSNTREFFEELLYGAKELGQGSNYKLRTDDIIRMSCKKAIKAGDKLSDMEIVALLRDLMDKRIPMTCPHGRPIMISLTKMELERMFKRIQ